VTVIGIDDTDSRERGMCTTYAATRLAARLVAAGATVDRTLLVRLHPAIEHKTRGNAALAVHCDADPATAADAVEAVLGLAATGDDRTNPGAVVADLDPDAVPAPVEQFARRAVRERCSLAEAHRLSTAAGFRQLTRGNGRGVVGALAATGAWAAFDEWTYECLSYREGERRGTERVVDRDSVFRAAETFYPEVWDTVDRVEQTAVCVPRTPGPVLHGIRGETADAVQAVAARIESEPVSTRRTFVTNQGTDAHLQRTSLSGVENGGCYRVDATVTAGPETREGGHVFLRLGEDTGSNSAETRLRAAAFEPTKRFRDRVRALRPGDRITACGEVGDDTLNLEKFAVRGLVRTERVTPTCPDCGRSMSSAGRDAGYRCRDCRTTAPGRVERPVGRDLDAGWYEVPPCARRHVAKPLVRGGFDAPTHPEQ
jgi:tRNA(Ile2)-agmatinylcytidine synthase